MKHTIGRLALAIAVALGAVGAQAKSEDLGEIDAAGTTFGNRFWGWGTFTDYYSFSIPGASNVGGSTVAYDSLWQDIGLTSVLLQTWTGSGWTAWSGGSNPDASPSQFSFSGLGGGEYRLALSGYSAPQIDLNDPLRPASYQGTLRAIAAPVPEPETLAMMMVGLAGVGAAAMRRRSKR